MFDKVLDKLGLYDLFGVMLPGIVACSITLIVDEVLLEYGLSKYLNSDNLMTFLVIGYFVGVVLQELGSISMKYLQKGEKLLKKALNPVNDSREHIPEEEWHLINSEVSAKLGKKDSVSLSLLYNYCNYSGGNSALADKDHSVAAMSRSLAVYFALLSVMLMGLLCAVKEARIAYFLCVSLFLMLLLWKRSERFFIIRYIRIVRTYYYQSIKKNEESQVK